MFPNIKKRFFKLSILDRYIFEQFTGPFVLAVGGFAIIAVVDILFFIVELYVISGVPFITVLRLLAYKLPSLMIMFFPMAVLFSVMLLLVRMAKDNEITVLRSSGVHSFRILLPLFLLVFFTSILSFWVNESVVPRANAASDDLIYTEIQKRPPPTIAENVVFKDGEDRFFYVRSVDSKSKVLSEIMVMERTANYPRIMTAESANWGNESWTLLNGKIMEFDKEGYMQFVDEFEQMVIHVNEDLRQFFAKKKTAEQMDSRELKDKITLLKENGMNPTQYQVEYYMKWSVPAACFIFGIMGIAFCINFVRSGKDWWGVIVAICVSVLMVGFYFFLVALFRAMGKGAEISPILAAWLPNIIYGGLSIAGISYNIKTR